MKKTVLILLFILPILAISQVTITPTAFDVNQSITITVDSKSTATDCNKFSNPTKVYMHSGIGDDTNPWSKTKGNWGIDDGVGQMTSNGDGTWSITITPRTYYGLTDTQAANATKMGVVFRNETGTQEFKDNGCKDFFINVGSFQLNLIAPTQNLTILSSGASLTIEASTTQASDFVLKANGATINTSTNTSTFSFIHTNITENITYSLDATNTGGTKSESFQVIVSIPEQPVPAGMKDGINLNPTDGTKATLVLYAPLKSVVHLIGDFNNWQLNNNYLLNKDTANNRFWIELTGLTPQTNHMYQYLVEGTIKIADPYSTTILDEFNDVYINATTYPNLPSYPTGKTNHAVTLLRTGDTPYNWQTPNFQKPAETDLVIYELLIRDFDDLHSFDAVKARLDYLQGLGINAIELMPVSEFDGNESWGYNPSFHMALDKYYGTPTAFKKFIDECHKRGIAVILDVVYNHASGQNPFYRMWNTDNGGYGGQASGDSPFFNPIATHTYSVFNDFNHSKQATKDYVKRTTQYWIDEYKIDGFRWDLTKGFTQNCNSSDEACTGSFQADRVAVLKEYADYQWQISSNFYVIFEHLGTVAEETEWSDYGIMLWRNMNNNYNQNTMGYSTDADISAISYKTRNWNTPNLVGYMESHDEERLMYKNLQYGNSNSTYNVKDLNTALSRQELAGMFFFAIPGPKMIWQFGELGYDISIDENGRVGKKPIHWEYFDNANRKQIYNTWSTLIAFKKQQPVFSSTYFTLNVGTLTKSILLEHPSMDVALAGNFDISSKTISVQFSKTGTWYEYFTGEEKNITNTSTEITLNPGEYKLYSTVRLLDPRGGTALDDSDGDGVADTLDLCPNTFPGTNVNSTGCPTFTLPNNNFTVEVTSETCPGKNNGQIKITAQSSLNYTTTINGVNYNFTNTTTAINLPPNSYNFCIDVAGETYTQCYLVEVAAGTTVSGKSSVSSGKASVEIEQGTAPFTIFINGREQFETSAPVFSVEVKKGDVLEVKTDVSCEGVYSKTIDALEAVFAYPNPTQGIFEITIPTAQNEAGLPRQVTIEIYNILSQLISVKTYPVVYGKVQLSLENKPAGLYIAKVLLDQPVSIKIIKQ